MIKNDKDVNLRINRSVYERLLKVQGQYAVKGIKKSFSELIIEMLDSVYHPAPRLRQTGINDRDQELVDRFEPALRKLSKE